MNRKSQIISVLMWSLLSAAFIGPGTITTAVRAGSEYQLQLLWAVLFSTVACIVVQELAARITISSGNNLGPSLESAFGSATGKKLKYLTGGVVILGCAAYEAGNILGAVAGLTLLTSQSPTLLTPGITLLAAVVLWIGRTSVLSLIMTALVAMMGIGFLIMAIDQPVSGSDIANALIPSIPSKSEYLLIALVGTTIVPYNLFLGSAISHGQTLKTMRLGLILSVAVGGLITATIVVGAFGIGPFTSFPELASALEDHLGSKGRIALGLGLFAAGFSSTITAPYASSLIVTSAWGLDKRMYRYGTWALVLMIGFLVSMSTARPVQVILSVQALNGCILPLLVAVVILVSNSPKVVSTTERHHPAYNIPLLVILGVVALIGTVVVERSMTELFGLPIQNLKVSLGVSLVLVMIEVILLVRLRRQ